MAVRLGLSSSNVTNTSTTMLVGIGGGGCGKILQARIDGAVDGVVVIVVAREGSDDDAIAHLFPASIILVGGKGGWDGGIELGG